MPPEPSGLISRYRSVTGTDGETEDTTETYPLGSSVMLSRMSEHPWVKITRGTPTAEDLAALVSALVTRAPRPAAPAPVSSRWARSGRPGTRTGWLGSALPR